MPTFRNSRGPTGFFQGYQAWRKNVSGVVKGPIPFSWDVTKTA